MRDIDDILSDMDAITNMILAGTVGLACDMIIALADETPITDAMADAWMTAARTIDPTLSGPGAMVRDTIRDNA